MNQILPKNPLLRMAGIWIAFLSSASLIDIAGISCAKSIPLFQRLPVIVLSALGAILVVSTCLNWCEARINASKSERTDQVPRLGALLVAIACVLVLVVKVFVADGISSTICR